MATEEQKNNQQTLNDLLQDYLSGQAEAAEYTALVTSRTADLTDAIRRSVHQKKVSTELDKQLLSSVKKLSDLSRSLENPYESISGIQKDITKNTKEQIKLENTLGALKSKLSSEEKGYFKDLEAQQKALIANEKTFLDLRKAASSIEAQAAEKFTDAGVNIKEADAQIKGAAKDLGGDIGVKNYEEKIKKTEKLKVKELEAVYEVRQAQEKLLEAESEKEKILSQIESAKLSNNQEAVRLAQDKLTTIIEEVSLQKSVQLQAEKNIDDLQRRISSQNDYISQSEREYQAALDTKKLAEERYKNVEEELKARQDINFITVENLKKAEIQVYETRTAIEKLQDTIAKEPELQAVKAAEEMLQISQQNAQYLEEEEKRQTNIVKLQGLYNVSLGFAEGLLSKLGASNAAIALGLEDGKKAADEMARAIQTGEESAGLLGGQLKVLGAGIVGTFKGMADGIKKVLSIVAFATLIGKLGGMITKSVLSPIKDVFGEIKGLISSGIDYLKNEFFSIASYINDFEIGDRFLQELSQSTEDIATGLGISTSEAKSLKAQVKGLSDEMGAVPEKLAHNMEELNKSFGTTQRFSDETARSFNRMVERLGFSTEESSQLVKISKLQGESTNNTLKTIEDQTLALKNQYGVAISSKSIYQEIAKASAATRLTLGNNAEELAKGAFQAKRLGLEMDQVASIGGSLLDFESSIANEMEAELLLGKDLNLERARQAALQGDIATVAKEIAGQIGSAAEFAEMNVIQQEALAKSVGVGRDELAKMLETQEMLANTGFDDMSQAQQEFNKLVENGASIEEAQAKFRQKYGNEALASQAAQVSYAKQRELLDRKILETQGLQAEAMRPIAIAFINIQRTVEKLKGTITKQLKPFFNEFAGLVGEGDDAFENLLNGPVTKLGSKLNDIGITLVRFFKHYGPDIKKVFSGVLDVFSSIYGMMGRVITRVFEVQSGGDGVKGIFQSITETLSKVANYIANIDVGKLINKISEFASNIKETFELIFEKVKSLTAFAKDFPGLTTAGVGALALTRMAPGSGGVVAPVAKGAVSAAGKLAGKAGNVVTQKLGLGKLFGELGSSPNKPLYVSVVGEGGGLADALGNSVSKALGRKAGIGGGFRSGAKGMLSYAKDAFKGGRAGTVGRARLARAAKGLVTGQGASFVGGSTRAASTAASATSTVGKVAGTGLKLGKAAAGVGAVVGLAAEFGFNKLKESQLEQVESLEKQIAITKDSTKQEELNEEVKKKIRNAELAGLGATTAKYAGFGAALGSIITPGIGTAIGGAVGALAGLTVGVTQLQKQRKIEASELHKFYKDVRNNQLRLEDQRKQLIERQEFVQIQRELALEKSTSSVKSKFEELTGSISNFDENALSNTSKEFQQFATEMYNAGNLTRTEFRDAINGTLTPLQTMEAASRNAASQLNKLYGVVDTVIAQEQQNAKEKVERELGISEREAEIRIFAASRGLANTERLSEKSESFFQSFEDPLTRGTFDLETEELAKLLKGEVTQISGVTQKEAGAMRQTLLESAASLYNINLKDEEEKTKLNNILLTQLEGMIDRDIDEASDIQEILSGIGSQYLNSYQGVVDKINMAVEGVEIAGLQAADPSQIQTILSSIITSSGGKQENIQQNLKPLLEQLNLTVEEVAKFGGNENIIDSEDINRLQELVVVQTTSTAINDQQVSEALKNIILNLAPTGPQLPVTFTPVDDGVITSSFKPQIQQVQDGSSVSNNGPFTIQDSKGNIAITHPKDKLVVSPNVSYIADGATGKGGPVFPVSEKFGALDVKVGKGGVVVQKIKDGFTGLSELKQAEEKGMPVEYQPGVNVVGVRGPFTSKDTIEPIQVGSRIIKGLGALAKMYNLSSDQKEERSNLQQEWNENYRIAYNLSKKGLDSQFAVEGVSPYFRTISKFERLVNSINRTEKEAISKNVPIFFHDMMAMEEGRAAYDTNDYGTAIQLGLTEGSGGAIKYNTQGLPSNVTMALNTYVEPSKLYKNYVPPTPEPEVTESIIPKQIIGSATERITVRGTEGDTFVTYENGKVVESNTLQPVEDGIGFWEVMTNPIGALKHYALPAIVEGSGHLVEALYKTKVFSGLFKKALHKTPIIGQAMHATTGALNLSHLLHEEGLSKDGLYQEIGKTALITMGGIAGGILGEVAMGALGLATGPGAIVLGMLGGAAGAMLGEIVAEGVADLVGARPVGELIAGMMSIGSHDEHHPTTEPAPNLAMVQPIASSIQKVADGGALAARGPFTITDKFGATAVTAKGDGIVVSPNISYVQDGVIDAEPIAPMVATPSQQHTTVVEQDNSDLKKELEDMKQLMSQLIKEIPAIANRPITIELDGNKVGEGLGRIGYRG